MGLVREMKKYGDTRVAYAMYSCGYRWRVRRRRPTNIERMVEGLPRCELERILQALK